MKTTPNTSTPVMLAFLNDKAVKSTFLKRVRTHRKLDEIRQSYGYWKPDSDGHFRGCAVGCTLHSGEHRAYERELGIPWQLAYLEDRLFENMPADKAKDWPVKFLEAINVGANLSTVVAEFLIWLLVDEKEGVLRFASEQGAPAIKAVAALYQRRMAGDEPPLNEWRTAHANASAAATADDAAARRQAARAGHAARYAAEAAVAAAAALAAEAAAEALAEVEVAVEVASYHSYCFRASEKLLEILRRREPAAPVRGKRLVAA